MNEGFSFKHKDYEEIYTGYNVSYGGESIYVILYGQSNNIGSTTYTEKEVSNNLNNGLWVMVIA